MINQAAAVKDRFSNAGFLGTFCQQQANLFGSFFVAANFTTQRSIQRRSSSQSGAGNVIDQLSDHSSGEEGWLEDIALKDAFKRLSKREKMIINMRYFGKRTQTEIAGEIGISQAQVSRLEKGALEKLRRQMV